MKKLFFTVLCTSLAFAGFAQNDAKTLFESGKAKMSKYDAEMVKQQTRQQFDSALMCESLLGGYADFCDALKLDTVPETEKNGTPKIDKKTGKQKVKTKYSKEIVGLISGHHNDFQNIGSIAYDRADYATAIKAWSIYKDLPKAQFLGSTRPAALADSTYAQYCYFVGVCCYFSKTDNMKAYESFAKAVKMGYPDKVAYDLLKQYFQMIAIEYLDKKDYDGCESFVNNAIAEFPTEAYFVMFKGVLIETKTNDIEQAIELYKKSVEMDPTLAQGYFHVGRYYNNKAVNTMNADENKNLTDEELSKLVNPYCEQALPYLKKAVELDETNAEAKRQLQWIEYRLGM